MEDGAIEHKVTRAMLDERFSASVGDIVEGVSEPNKDLPWHERKQSALENIKIINGPTLWVKSADVISNVSELLDDYRHFSRRLMKCKECGQLYFKEFYETTDYIGGNDPQYVTLVPVYSKEDIEKLKATSMFDLLKFRPHISSNFPSDADRPSVCWVGR